MLLPSLWSAQSAAYHYGPNESLTPRLTLPWGPTALFNVYLVCIRVGGFVPWMEGDLSSTNGGKASSKDEEVILANGVGNLEFLIVFCSA